jgi:hypothetical protein
MLLLCNEAARRGSKRGAVAHKKDANGVQCKPLGLEYIVDRIDVDDPLTGKTTSLDRICCVCVCVCVCVYVCCVCVCVCCVCVCVCVCAVICNAMPHAALPHAMLTLDHICPQRRTAGLPPTLCIT